MDFQITVSTEVLREKAGEISTTANTIKREWEEIRRIVTNSEYYWQGKSSRKHLDLLKKSSEDADTITRRLAEHPEDLLKMAGIYEDTEQKITELNIALPSDVIV